ncbi:DUF5983 family protein [Cupriavidus sp. RAF12]|uniref:DUF5983 family protein n=1 Tax=Cupriavidus sp. RAF12 TaxID=3233050 RepID=UPI003F8F7132
MTTEIWTTKLPVLSTCHISESTRDRLHAAYLNPAPYRAVAMCAVYVEGFFIRFWDDDHDDSEIDMPDDLVLIKGWLKDNNFEDLWVRLDADGDVIPGLLTYEW